MIRRDDLVFLAVITMKSEGSFIHLSDNLGLVKRREKVIFS
jgi:hypothetical protein